MTIEPTAYPIGACIAFTLAWSLYDKWRDSRRKIRSYRQYRRLRDAA